MKKILVVDSLEPFLKHEKSMLDREDFQVFTAKTGTEALDIHRRERVNAILTDLNVPELNGDELVRAIRSDPALKSVSVIVISSLRKADLERCASCGANDYITRPIDQKKLLAKISQLLDIPERRSLRVLIKVTVKGSFGSEPFFGSTHNISVSGLLLETDKVLARGDIIACSFFIPDSERIMADGEVMRVAKAEKGFHYGVRFLDIKEKDKAIIENFVAKSAA
ncbi:MAG: response regulator [Nitrospiraceae bacterium]|nr:response regulator [Nitrospiraceae bacterium]